MNFFDKVRNKLTYTALRPTIYNDGLRKAYSSTSVTGGTIKRKNTVITGGTSGIGFATAQRLLDEGCNVIIIGRSEEKCKTAIEKLRKTDNELSYTLIDFLNSESIKHGVEQIFNNQIIDIWINCAGIFKDTDRERKFRGINKDTYFEVINTNCKATVLTMQLVSDLMIKHNINGQIINIASICGLSYKYGFTPYGISKTGVIEYTRMYAEKFKNKLSIVAIAPGSVVTRMGDKYFGGDISGSTALSKHVALPEEIAAIIAFAASPIGRHLNGQTIVASAMETL